MQKLSVRGAAIAAGVTWAIYIAFCGWSAAFDWGGKIVDVFSSLYIGYAPSFLGGIIGGLWAFIDGLIAGLIFALIYNRFAR